MIKANELRINNWVKRNDMGGVYTIRSVSDDRLHPIALTEHDNKKNVHYACECTLSELEPISLTTLVLEKAGFINLLNEKDEPSREWLLNGVTLFMGFNFIHLHRFNQWVYNYAWTGDKAPDCEYLHQLQNLYYALCGVELNINL